MQRYKITTTGLVYTGSGFISDITLIAGSANASVSIQDTLDGSDADKDVGGAKALANTSENSSLSGQQITTGIYVTIAGAGAVAYVYIK